MPSPFRLPALLAALTAALAKVTLADPSAVTVVTNAAPDALTAQARLAVAPGLKVELWAGEPLVQNITSFCFDNLGRAYVVETGRRRTSVFDIRGLQPWLDNDYSFRTVNDRETFLKRVLTPGDPDHEKFLGAIVRKGGFDDFNHDGGIDARDLEVESERIRLVWDAEGKGQADHAITFADGFHTPVSGVAAGVLAQGTNVWFTCIPDLWRFQASDEWRVTSDKQGTEAEPPARHSSPVTRHPLLTGFGVHIAFGGHDLHGLIKGPDGRLYFSIADRGSCVTNREGLVIALPDCGAVFRCEPDGSYFEVFAKGLRNPQELCFDDFGNLWTGDNNADGGDKARWTLVLEGADYGWTIGWQWLPKLGAWNSERLWHTRESNTAAYIVPPVAYMGHGPAGIAYYPGTGLPARYDRHFFLSDFPGGVRAFAVEPDGAFFKVVPEPGADLASKWQEDNSAANLTGKVLWDLSPVDVAFPPGGGVTVADWVQGWDKTGKGRLWHVYDPALVNDPLIAETKRLLAEGMMKRSEKELLALLGHRDQRVRLEAQWELAGRGPEAWSGLRRMAGKGQGVVARLHALWGLDMVVRQNRSRDFLPELTELQDLLTDPEPLVRAQAARLLGRAHLVVAQNPLLSLFADRDARVAAAAVLAYRDLFSAFNNSPYGGLRFRQGLLERLLGWLPPAIQQRISTPQPSGSVIWPNYPLEKLLSSPAAAEPAIRDGAARLLAEVGQSMGPANQAAFLANLPTLTTNSNPNVRLSLLLAERRLASSQITTFLGDSAPLLVLEAARAINDVPIGEAMPALAALLQPAALKQVTWDTTLNFTRDEWRAWILRRAVNANFRLGNATNATALTDFAGRTDAPESIRVEALEDLADWAKPPGRDKIVGLWRPLPPRDPAPARDALAASWPKLTSDASTNVVLATLHAGASLGLDGFPGLLAALQAHPSEAVRAEAARLAATGKTVSVGELETTLAQGKLADQQTAFAALGASPEPAAVGVLADWVKQVTAGKVAAALQLDVLDAATRAAKISGKSPALLSALAAWTNSLPKGDPLAPYRPALTGGDAARGRKLFTERQDLACFRCHKLHGEGGEVGPELAGIGRTKGREYVLRSILFPNADIAAGFENVVLTLKDGTSVSGVLKSESDTELVIQSPEDGRVTVKKAALAARERGPSAMIEGLGDLLSPRDLRDIVEALAE
ncbi:MAG TPA: PQQ-dependent sugar dehydrogenase [Candidatus Limnocylindria bacterium]|nr:PQQ-dependent sugar dehydrogenase [Candidatus Limnocylindria bacterium]